MFMFGLQRDPEIRTKIVGVLWTDTGLATLDSENLLTVSLQRSGCLPAESCPPEKSFRIGQDRSIVATRFLVSRIFPAF